MSRANVHKLQCPHCGNQQDASVWESVNVTLDPDLKAELYAGELNVLKCDKCGEKAFINVPLLYHDMDNEFCVQYYPEEAIDAEAFVEQFNADGSLAVEGIPTAIGEPGAYLARPHIVFSIDEMVNYVRFRDALAASLAD